MHNDDYNYGYDEPMDTDPPPHEEVKPTKPKPQKKEGLKELTSKLNQMMGEKLSSFEQSSQEAFGYLDDVAKQIQTSSRDLETATKTYAINVERFNKRHIIFSDLPKTIKASISIGVILTLFVGIGLGIFLQEGLTIADRSGGWNNYVIQTHLTQIQRCRSQARETGKPVNCNIVEKP